MSNTVKIRSIEHLTHDVLKIVLDKPQGLHYRPGQACDVSINKKGWEDQLRPFTFVSLEEDDFIEFNIKTYPERQSVTNELLTLKAGDELIIGDVFGAITYKGEGIFLAGGAGITPMLAIFNHLSKHGQLNSNKLIFANKESRDIILKDKFDKMLGKNFVNVLSDEDLPPYRHGFITKEIIKEFMDDQTKYFYICGPDPMIVAMEKALGALGVKPEQIVKEE